MLNSKESIDALYKYGDAIDGGMILRELLVPSDITLHALHYALQRAFGWQNSHLRSFELPKAVFDTLTQGTVKGWSDLVGEWFQAPSNFESPLFWDDNYEAGSIKKWLKAKYTGPYVNGGYYDKKSAAKRDIQALLDRFPEFRVAEVFHVLSPVIHYNYDFGDNWQVTIERADTGRAAELVRSKHVKQSELDLAESVVLREHRPVCIYRRGMNVLDDVGGLAGFARFLEKLYGARPDETLVDEDSAESWLTWAKD